MVRDNPKLVLSLKIAKKNQQTKYYEFLYARKSMLAFVKLTNQNTFLKTVLYQINLANASTTNQKTLQGSQVQ